MKTTLIAFAVAASASAAVTDINWNVETYEPRTPVITGNVASGFHGSVAPMKRMDMRAVNGLTDVNRSWKGAAWRNERVNVQFALWTRELSHGDVKRIYEAGRNGLALGDAL